MGLCVDFLPGSVARVLSDCQIAPPVLALPEPAPILALAPPSSEFSELWGTIKHAVTKYNSVSFVPDHCPKVRIGSPDHMTAPTFHIERAASTCFVTATTRRHPLRPRFFRVDITIEALLVLCERALHQYREGQFQVVECSRLATGRRDYQYPVRHGWRRTQDPDFPARDGWKLVEVRSVMPASYYREYVYRRIDEVGGNADAQSVNDTRS